MANLQQKTLGDWVFGVVVVGITSGLIALVVLNDLPDWIAYVGAAAVFFAVAPVWVWWRRRRAR